MSAWDDLSCFKAYDVRGRVPFELNLQLVRQIGLAFAAEFKPESVCVGHDMRLSSRDMALVLSSALQDGGANVTDLGLCGTEEVYHACFSEGFDGGIMITASHNPKDWNGLKFVGPGAKPLSGEKGLFALRDRIKSGDLPLALRRGHEERKSFRASFVELLLSLLGPKKGDELKPMKVVADAGNGCAWLVLRELADKLPITLVPVREEPDGSFPHGVPNPLLPENRAFTADAVRAHKADLGIAFDGDFDRCFFFDEQGRAVEGYYIVGLLAEALLEDAPGEKIVHDTRLIWNTRELVSQAGGIPLEHKTGHAFMKERLRAENALYGGEMSAHHYFRDFGFCDSGMLVWLLVCRLLGRRGKPLSALVSERMARYPVSGEINRSLQDPDAALARIQDAFAKDAPRVGDIDGLSMEFADWRCNVRKSNTEPLLRLNVESRGDEALMRRRTEELLALMT